ncbi:unnamed protein product [Calypogeia fissa]
MAASPLAAAKVEELLKEVRVDYYGRTKVVESAVRAVRELLLGLPVAEVSAALASASIKALGVPEEKAAFKFHKPDSVEVVGSYASQTVTKPLQNVDLAVRMPKACFHEKDFLNHRYYAKRILYLAHLERKLRKCSAISSIVWSSFCWDSRKPILVLRPGPDETGTTTKFFIRILPSISTDVFDISKLVLGRNNVREAKDEEGTAKPTPFYNSGIMEDMLMEGISAWLQSGLSKSSALRDALSLAKVWLRQRTSVYGQREKLSGFLLSALMVHLSSPAGKSRITEHMTSLQAFRVTLEAIGNSDVLGKGIYLQKADSNARTSDAKQLMKTSFDVVMSDPAGHLNLAHRLTRSSLLELKEDAIHSLEALKGTGDGGFDAIFMTPVDFGSKFDYHVRLDVPSQVSTASPWCLDQERSVVYEKHVEDLLFRALGDRATLVRVIQRSLPSGWKPSSGLQCIASSPLYVGIILNSIDIALRMADIGPNADNKDEANKFRAFWGERSELRRFKDGKISETAVWEIEPWKRHLIISQIVHHILGRHLSLPSSAIKVSAGQLDFALLVRDKDQVSVMPKLLDAFETLSKRLRGIENLPLKIVSVQPLSAAFRHTAVYYPQPHPLADESAPQKLSQVFGACPDPLEIVMQLEGSGRWPDDPVAIQKTKVAFCLQIADSMQQKWGISCIAAEDAVDLLMQGFAFRLSILYDKDPTNLNKERIASSLVKGKNVSVKFDSTASKQQIPEPKSDLLLRSVHASVLYGLHGTYPAYSPVVRLAKRWLASHLLSGIIAEEAVELIVAYLFVSPASNRPPSSRITGFLRFLQLLDKHDWALAPLIVDVNGELTAADKEQIHSQFEKQQNEISTGTEEDLKKVPAIYIATAYDMGSETWTRASPTGKALKRLVAYARSSATLLNLLIRGDGDETRWQSLFRTSLDNYDLVILLHQESLPHPSRVLFPGFLHEKPVRTMETPNDVLSLVPERILKRGIQAARNHLLIGFDPITLFVDELKERVGESCTIWHDTIGSDTMGLTMSNPVKPEARKAKRKKLENGHSSLESLIRHLEECGNGFVRSIYVPEKLSSGRK